MVLLISALLQAATLPLSELWLQEGATALTLSRPSDLSLPRSLDIHADTCQIRNTLLRCYALWLAHLAVVQNALSAKPPCLAAGRDENLSPSTLTCL